MIYVYDVSYICALIIPDEKTPRIDKLHRAINENDEVFAPQLLWYEITNILKNLNKRKRYTSQIVAGFFPMLSAIRLITDFETGVTYCDKLLSLCNFYNLPAYSAANLELADRKKAILCTLDDDLIVAAKKHGVTIINES